MIKTLEVTNFQGHKYSLIEFDKGVNSIKGTSHHGKSSLIRALRWAILNKPSGFPFKSWFSSLKDTTKVSIEFENNSFATRTRDNKFNGYYLTGQEDGLEALRTDVPEEVSLISRMKDINIQSQADKYFMLQVSPGIVAKELNKIVGLDIIDDVNRKVTEIFKSSNTISKHLAVDIKDKKEELKKYKNVNRVGKLIKQIDILYNELSHIHKDIDELVLYRTEIIDAQTNLDNLNDWLDIEEPFKEIRKKQHEYTELQNKMVDVSKLVKQCKHIEDEISLADTVIGIEEDVKDTKELCGEVSELKNKHDKLEKIYNDAQITKKSLKTTSDTLVLNIKKKSELLKQHADDFCLKCGAYRQHWRKK